MPLSWNSINTFPAESVDDTWITSGWSFATNFRPLASKFWNTAASRLPRPTTVVTDTNRNTPADLSGQW